MKYQLELDDKHDIVCTDCKHRFDVYNPPDCVECWCHKIPYEDRRVPGL